MKEIQEAVFPLVLKYKGSWSGEHGDGIVRGGFNQRFFGEEIYEGFREIKRLFDPEGRMNPGKVLDTPPMEANRRFGSDYKPQAIATAFHFREFGGMLQAVEQCTGVAACRKTLSGVMCPSYMATRDEMHSTRARANALRLALSGQLGDEALGSEEMLAVMDLCLACKGCKGECPSSVDMARLKSEVLYQRRQWSRLRPWLFSHQARLARLVAGPQAMFINRLLRMGPVRRLLQRIFGLDADRPLPAFASQRLSRWFESREASIRATGQTGRVVLFNDTYMEHYLPQVGRAAVEVLEAAGYRVDLATLGDSQRSAISQGDLDKAKREGRQLFERLDLWGNGAPILVCEPSCASALMDDLPDLLDDERLAGRVSQRVKMLDHFIEQELAEGRCSLALKPPEEERPRHFLVHGHCHQKALNGGRWTQRLLARIPNAVVEDSDAGCCGMAGSFGYEKEHAQLSRSIAEQRLLPAISKAPPEAIVVSNGFSCRHQIRDLSYRSSKHVIEVLHTFIL
jgi:Fe-S oxidoreductase